MDGICELFKPNNPRVVLHTEHAGQHSTLGRDVGESGDDEGTTALRILHVTRYERIRNITRRTGRRQLRRTPDEPMFEFDGSNFDRFEYFHFWNTSLPDFEFVIDPRVDNGTFCTKIEYA